MKTLIRTTIATLGLALTGWANAMTTDTPAILSMLAEQDVKVIDDAASAEVRGEATKYVYASLVQINGTSGYKFMTKDGGTASVGVTGSNPLKAPYQWRYGYWGGSGWSNGTEVGDNWFINFTTANLNALVSSLTTVDAMDNYFRQHDISYAQAALLTDKKKKSSATAAADKLLLSQLKNNLYNSTDPKYSSVRIFDSNLGKTNPNDATAPYKVRIGLTVVKPYEIPFSEFMRRQAVTAFKAKIILNKL